MVLFDIAFITFVLVQSVLLKKVGEALCLCVEREPSFFGLFRIPKALWWYSFSFLLTYHALAFVTWVLFGACIEQNDPACAAACINVRVDAVKALLARQHCSPPVAKPPTIVEMILDGYWH